MQKFLTGPIVVAAFALLAIVGGCAPSQLNDTVGSVNLLPKVSTLARPDWLTYSGAKEDFTLRSVTAGDLVTAEGQCAMTAAEAPSLADGTSDASAQPGLLPGGISLQMTECDVVRRAGAPEQLQIGADERGDRTVAITYIRGPRPGVYRFAAGRLVSIERGPEAPAATKAAPKAKAKKAPAKS